VENFSYSIDDLIEEINQYCKNKKIDLENKKSVEKEIIQHPNYKQIVTLPNDTKIESNWRKAILDYLKEDTTNLSLHLSSEIDNDKKVVNVFITPIVNSA